MRDEGVIDWVGASPLENRLPEGSRELLHAIRDLTHASTGDIARAIGISRPVAIRRLKHAKVISHALPVLGPDEGTR